MRWQIVNEWKKSPPNTGSPQMKRELQSMDYLDLLQIIKQRRTNMTFKMRYVVTVFLLLLSLVGAVFCGYSAMNSPSMLMCIISVIGVVAWCVIIRVCLYTIAIGRRM